ncbi:hypothetical protein WA158_004847 [Blastocystis sp. Blastoise]
MSAYRILKVARAGESILSKTATNVADVTTEQIQTLLGNMMYTVVVKGGLGLSAPQVHRPLRLFVMRDFNLLNEKPELKEHLDEVPLFAVANPEIKWKSRQLDGDFEGCFSFPNKLGYVIRPKEVHVSYINGLGEYKEELYKGMAARVFLHEYDHLNGLCLNNTIQDGLMLPINTYKKFYDRVQEMIKNGEWKIFMKGSNIADCYWGDGSNLTPEDINIPVFIENTKKMVQAINKNKENIFDLNDKDWNQIFNQIEKQKKQKEEEDFQLKQEINKINEEDEKNNKQNIDALFNNEEEVVMMDSNSIHQL